MEVGWRGVVKRAAGRRGLAIELERPRCTFDLEAEIHRFAEKSQTCVNLKNMIDTASGKKLWLSWICNASKGFSDSEHDEILIQYGSFLHRELPVRLSRAVRTLEEIPDLATMPSVKRVKSCYEEAFRLIRYTTVPHDVISSDAFGNTLDEILNMHRNGLVTMARGVYELRKLKSFDEHYILYEGIDRLLDKFYTIRIGIWSLISHYLATRDKSICHNQGLVNPNTPIAEVVHNAIENSRTICTQNCGGVPPLALKGDLRATCPYVPAGLYYIATESIKNAMRAVMLRYPMKSKPAIDVIIQRCPEKNHLIVRILDKGIGMSKSQLKKIWSYFYTTADSRAQHQLMNNKKMDDTPLAGLGFGLPISRLYARYYGGDIFINSELGVGTSCDIHLDLKGDAGEPLIDSK